MIYTEYGSLLRLNVAISGFLRYLWLTAKYGLRQTSESRFLTLIYSVESIAYITNFYIGGTLVELPTYNEFSSLARVPPV